MCSMYFGVPVIRPWVFRCVRRVQAFAPIGGLEFFKVFSGHMLRFSDEHSAVCRIVRKIRATDHLGEPSRPSAPF